MTCPHTSTLGVYLLGALEPEERSTFESHLYGCDVCRAELVRLAPLPGLLNQIAVTDIDETAETAESLARAAEPAPNLAPDLAPEPAVVLDLPAPVVLEVPDEPTEPPESAEPTEAAPPRRRRWLVAAAAAAAVLVLAVAGFLGFLAMHGSTSDDQAHSVMWSAVDPQSGVTAKVQLTERSWGTDIKVWMSDVPGTKECRLVVKAKYGYHDRPEPYVEIAGWWTSRHSPTDDIPGSTSIDLASIYKLEIMDGDRMLVGIPPARS
jgi:anti-sigma factor RsiW